MHGMLNEMIAVHSRCLFCLYLRLFTMPCPKFGAKSGLTQHVVVGRCCLGLKSSMRNVSPCWWEPGFFPGGRSDAGLWAPGSSWGPQRRKYVAAGLLLFYLVLSQQQS